MADFLFAFIDPVSGDVPNIGANDGSLEFLITAAGYRDFRPSVQVASALFKETTPFEDQDSVDSLAWISEVLPACSLVPAARTSVSFFNGGFAVLIPQQNTLSWSTIRYPRFKFRPSHADLLHFDLWHRGRNILQDSGTYSYNTTTELSRYFTGISGHNTIEFDRTEPLRQVSTFLVADWPKVTAVTSEKDWVEGGYWSGEYKTRTGAMHRRRVEYRENKWIITDTISGYKTSAILRWHLCEGSWELIGNTLLSPEMRIAVSSNVAIKRFQLLGSPRSLFYLQMNSMPLLEAEVSSQPAEIITEIDFLCPT
jgi:hypothetical protein